MPDVQNAVARQLSGAGISALDSRQRWCSLATPAMQSQNVTEWLLALMPACPTPWPRYACLCGARPARCRHRVAHNPDRRVCGFRITFHAFCGDTSRPLAAFDFVHRRSAQRDFVRIHDCSVVRPALRCGEAEFLSIDGGYRVGLRTCVFSQPDYCFVSCIGRRSSRATFAHASWMGSAGGVCGSADRVDGTRQSSARKAGHA